MKSFASFCEPDATSENPASRDIDSSSGGTTTGDRVQQDVARLADLSTPRVPIWRPAAGLIIKADSVTSMDTPMATGATG